MGVLEGDSVLQVVLLVEAAGLHKALVLLVAGVENEGIGGEFFIFGDEDEVSDLKVCPLALYERVAFEIEDLNKLEVVGFTFVIFEFTLLSAR